MPKKSVILAPNVQLPFDDPKVPYPALTSCKLDGNRFVLIDGEWLSRSLKPQGNKGLSDHLPELTEMSKKEGLVFDGELFSHELTFPELQSVIRAHSKDIPSHIHAHTFDCLTLKEWEATDKSTAFQDRFDQLANILSSTKMSHTTLVEHHRVHTPQEAEAMYQHFLDQNQEGMILRDPNGLYKHGRATHNSGQIFKYKEFRTWDGKILEVVQRKKLKEGVVREKNELGRTARTSKAEHYELDNNCGGFIVEVMFKGEPVQVGIGYGKGWPLDQRKTEHWDKRDELVGQICEFQSMTFGDKDAPRMGGFLRLRPDRDGEL
jgi:DNA ligase-1